MVFLRRAFLNDLDMNMCDYDGRTPLHLAAAEGHFDCVKFLMEVCKVNPEPMDRYIFWIILFDMPAVCLYLTVLLTF